MNQSWHELIRLLSKGSLMIYIIRTYHGNHSYFQLDPSIFLSSPSSSWVSLCKLNWNADQDKCIFLEVEFMLHRVTKPCIGCSHLLWSAKEKDHSMPSHPTRLFSISENSIQQTHLCHLDSFPSIMFSTRSTTQTVLSFRFQKLSCPIPLRSHCAKWESARRQRGVVQRGNTEDISITHISAPWPVSHPFKRATTAARASDTSWTGAWH